MSLYSPEQVKRGKELASEIDKRQFELGDLICEFLPEKSTGYTSVLASFAEAIGHTPAFTIVCWDTARKWPKTQRSRTNSYGVHAALRNLDGRFELNRARLTIAQARELARRKPTSRIGLAMNYASSAKMFLRRIDPLMDQLDPGEIERVRATLRAIATEALSMAGANHNRLTAV